MAGVDGFGTALARSDMGSTPTFTDVANVTSISGPGLTKADIDVTSHDSPDNYQEWLAGLKDGGEVSMDINWDPAETTQQVLISDFNLTGSAANRDYRIEFPDGATWAFAGYVKGFEPTAPHDDKLTASVTFKVNGKPTFTPAA